MTLLPDGAHAMTVEDFLVFTEARPDGERWELIDGEPVLSPSPSYGHQKIVLNLSVLLGGLEDGADWEVLPGLGAKLSAIDMPVPDILIRPNVRISGHHCDDMIVAFEVLSRSSVRRDLIRKRQAYGELPSLQHYVVLAQDRIDVRCYNRAGGWAERRLTDDDTTLPLDHLGIALDLARIYRGVLA